MSNSTLLNWPDGFERTDPVAGYPYTEWWCFDCGESTRIESAVK